MTAAKQAKEQVVARDGVGADLMPLLLLAREDELVAMVPLNVREDRVPGLINLAVRLTCADAVMHVTEIYALTTDNEADAMYPDPPLVQRFAQGDPNVTECLAVACFDRFGDTEYRRSSYRYVGRSVVWEEPFDLVTVMGGTVFDAVMDGFFAVRGDPVPFEDLVAGLGAAGANQVIVPGMTESWRAKPCPCGSGREYQKCCLS